jgi:alcohol dehydrogenase YqhD (iron-dependent ADH family)
VPRFLKFLEKEKTIQHKLYTLKGIFKPVVDMETFLSSLNISTDLSDYGVKKGEINLLVNKTKVKSDIQITPSRVEEADIARIYNMD